MDRDLGNGSIQRFDPKTGKPRVISGADAARTALTRERDAELSMQAGAPPIAQGASRAQPGDAEDRQRLISLASARPDRNITPETVGRATPEQVRGELSALGAGAQLAARQQGASVPKPSGPLAPASAARTTLAPSDPNNPDSPLVPTTPQDGSARPAAPKVPNYGARQDGNVTRNNFGEIINPATGMVNVAADNADFVRSRPLFGTNMEVAAGPNISFNDPRNPNTPPSGSTGYARKDGTYTVEGADGKRQSFANEAAASANFQSVAARPQAMQAGQALLARQPAPAQPAPAMVPPPAPRADAAPDAASQAWAQNSAGRGAGQPTTAPGFTMPAQAPVIPFGDARNPVADVTPAVQAQPAAPMPPQVSPQIASIMATASAPPTPVATPVNSPMRPVKEGAVKRDVRRLYEGSALDVISQPQVSRRQVRQGAKPALNPNRDAGSVPEPDRAPLFDDQEPAAFPTFTAPTGTSRPRASLA